MAPRILFLSCGNGHDRLGDMSHNRQHSADGERLVLSPERGNRPGFCVGPPEAYMIGAVSFRHSGPASPLAKPARVNFFSFWLFLFSPTLHGPSICRRNRSFSCCLDVDPPICSVSGRTCPAYPLPATLTVPCFPERLQVRTDLSHVDAWVGGPASRWWGRSPVWEYSPDPLEYYSTSGS